MLFNVVMLYSFDNMLALNVMPHLYQYGYNGSILVCFYDFFPITSKKM